MNISTTAGRKISEALALMIAAANEARFVPNFIYVTGPLRNTCAPGVFAHIQRCVSAQVDATHCSPNTIGTANG
jgi:hypothetical protein